MCTFYFAHNMFDKDSLACVDVFFPSTVSVHALLSMGAGHILFEYCSIRSCDWAFIGFQIVPDRPYFDPNIWCIGCLVWMVYFFSPM